MPYRRYAPALIFASALLLLVAIAPSRGVPRSGATAFAPFTPSTSAPGVVPSQQPGPATSLAPGATAGPVSSAAPGVVPSSRPGGVPAPTAATVPTGDTAHCRNGKQFALQGFIAAPPCQATFTGGSNGGATYPGVTKTQVNVVYYVVKPSAAVNAITAGRGLVPTEAELNAVVAAQNAFVNKRYELWGRKLVFSVYQSPSCMGTPPSDDCFRQDARALIAQDHPFAVVFPQNATAPGFQDELSKAGVINFGGIGLPSSFNTSRRPYRYDYSMDGDTQAVLAGEFYCKRLSNQRARFAGSAALQAKNRKAEILVPDSPLSIQSAQHLQQVINACDSNGAVIKTYSPDTSQAATQATTLASQAKQSGVTTLLYFTDPILPVYLTPQLTAQSYFPENVTVGSGFLDYDTLAQLYDTQQWRNAFGLGNVAQSQPVQGQDCYAAYKDGGGAGTPYLACDGAQSYFSSVAAGVQQAGANLNPGTFERGLLTLPSWGGDNLHTLVQYGAGDYTGQSDTRTTYWVPSATSPANGRQGAYLPLDGGKRFRAGTFPSTPLVIPGRG